MRPRRGHGEPPSFDHVQVRIESAAAPSPWMRGRHPTVLQAHCCGQNVARWRGGPVAIERLGSEGSLPTELRPLATIERTTFQIEGPQDGPRLGGLWIFCPRPHRQDDCISVMVGKMRAALWRNARRCVIYASQCAGANQADAYDREAVVRATSCIRPSSSAWTT